MGILLGGLLTGILASRVVSGIMGEHFGWRAIYYVATVLMAVCLVVNFENATLLRLLLSKEAMLL